MDAHLADTLIGIASADFCLFGLAGRAISASMMTARAPLGELALEVGRFAKGEGAQRRHRSSRSLWGRVSRYAALGARRFAISTVVGVGFARTKTASYRCDIRI